MKTSLAAALASGATIIPLTAAISIEIQVGTLRDASSNPVSDGSIWAVIVDQNGDNLLPGGLSVNTSSSLTTLDAAAAYEDFNGKTIQADAMINGDKILQVFFVEGEDTSGMPALSIQTITLTDAQWQAYSGKQWGIYWFPGLSPLPVDPPSNNNPLPALLPSNSSFQLGAIREISAGSAGDLAMVIPTYVENNAPTYTAAFLDDSTAVGGDIATSRFGAITAIPEPSVLVLSLLGSAALLRRRRA